MKDSNKTKRQLISELAEAHQQITQLQTAQAKRNQMGNELRESDRRCLTIIGERTQLISRFLHDATLTFVNEAYCRYFGKKPQELIGHSFMPLVLGEYREKMREHISSLTRENSSATRNYQLLAANGKSRWLQWTNQAIFGKAGDITELQAVAQDITEHKYADDELRRSEEKYRSLILNIPDIAWTTDEKYRIVFVSPNIEHLTGYTPEEEYRFSDWLRWFERVHPDDTEDAEAAFQALMEGKKHFDMEYRFKRKDGQWIWIHDRSVGTYEKDGALYADGLFSDITERKRAEEEREELQQKAELNSRLASIGQMASGVAHEINNPLASVIALTEVLAQKGLPEVISEDVEIIHDAAQRIASIVNRLLTFARQQRPEQTYVDINTVIQATLALRTHALETGHIKLTSQLVPNLPRTMADAAQLQQVFLNIILNAESAMKSVNGGGNLFIKTKRVSNTIRIWFTDDGPGIAKENLTRVFEPFFTTKEVGQGTGLGLSICHGIVAAHNGQISARSRSDRGATFIVELPVVADEKRLDLAELPDETAKATGQRC